MNPRIFEYADGNIIILAETYSIPELKALIDKYGEEGCKPYLTYCYLMTVLDSPYSNLDSEEKEETVIYDVINTIGDFDIEEELLEPALKKLTKLYTTQLTLFFEEIKNELHRIRMYLKNTDISGGKDGDLSERFRILKEAGTIVNSYNKTKQAALEEVKAKARGKGKIGDY
jgi:hypothetical protein